MNRVPRSNGSLLLLAIALGMQLKFQPIMARHSAQPARTRNLPLVLGIRTGIMADKQKVF